MKEIVVPPVVAPSTTGTLADLPGRNAARAPHDVAFSRLQDRRWVAVSNAEFAAQVEALAKGLVAAGVEVGDRVAIMSRTRYEWTLADFAIWAVGAIPVPIYETSSAEQLRWIINDAAVGSVLLESAEHAALLESVREDLPSVRDVWQIDAGAIEDLVARGADAGIQAAEIAELRTGLDRSGIATIIYTSGSTGRPKGCHLTHGNFLDLAENTVAKLGEVVLGEDAATVLFLPLAHVFARFVEVLCVSAGVRMGHSNDITRLLPDFQSFQPTFVLAVPRVFEKIYNSAEQQTTARGRGKVFHLAAQTAVAWSRAQDRPSGAGPLLAARHLFFDRLVYAKLRALMGGKVGYAVSGGGPLGERLGHFFRGVGIVVLEGYGLTESTAPAVVNVPEKIKIGTVGTPLPGVGVRLADDGEILLRGNNIFVGYHNNPAATAEAMDGDWFQTGDLGELDDDGYLRITGRKKELIVTAGGKNVAPGILEDRLRAHPLVSQCIVVGEGKPFIGALISLDAEMLPGWAANNGVEGLREEDARENATVRAAIQEAVDEANRTVSRPESIRSFAVLPGDLTIENGYLTPKMSIKRHVVLKDFAADVEALYDGSRART